MRKDSRRGGFTLIEIMVAVFIFSILVTTLFSSYNSIFSKAKAINQRVGSYEMARNCINRMIIDLKSMRLTLLPEYAPPDSGDPPDPYRIVGSSGYAGDKSFSRLRFASMEHLPIDKGFKGGVAEIVYYVCAAGEKGFVLKRADRTYPYDEPFEEKAGDPVLCENIKSLAIKYYDLDEDEYEFWDSESKDFDYASPRSIGIELEIYEGSADIEDENSTFLLFETGVRLPVYREKKD